MMPHECISLVNRFHETIDDVLLVESGSADSGSESIVIGGIVKRDEVGLAAPFIDTLVPVSATSATCGRKNLFTVLSTTPGSKRRNI